jgi:two-component system, response regulator YesN
MTRPILVYIVEDNPTEGMIFQLALAGHGTFKTRYFKSGTEMLLELENEMPDILITDLIMPDIFGLDLIREVKRIAPQIRTVIMSGKEDWDIISKSQAEGVFNYVVKNENSIPYLRQILADLAVLVRQN